jgi:hypothetical protein
LNEGIDFTIKPAEDSNIFLLNKDISSIFTIEEYINVVKNNEEFLRKIYHSSNMEMCAKLLKTNPNFRCNISEDNFLQYILNTDCINIIGSEYIAKSNQAQQNTIYLAAPKYDLLKRYLDLNSNFVTEEEYFFHEDFINRIGLDKLAMIDTSQQETYVRFYYKDKLPLLFKILAINPKFKLYYNQRYDIPVYDNRFINIFGIQTVAFLTKEEQEQICYDLERRENYHYYGLSKQQSVRNLKETTGKIKTIGNDRRKNH